MKHTTRPLEIKSFEETGVFEGYGSVFGNADWYGDVVMPGAFANSLAKWRAKGKLPPLLWQHAHDKPIGIYEDVAEDEHGLRVRGRLLVDEVALAREAYALLKAGAVSGLSIGYNTVREEYDQREKVNHLKEVELWETSLVTFPANEDATVSSVKTIRDFERFLRDAGFSRNEAKRIASQGFGDQRDAGEEASLIAVIKQNINILRG